MFFAGRSGGKAARRFSRRGLSKKASRWLWLLLVICFPATGWPAWFKKDAAIMGTAVHVEFWWLDTGQADAWTAEVLNIMHNINDRMSPFIAGSELSRINSRAARKPQSLSPQLFEVYKKALHISRLTGGAFDVSFASVGRFYDYRKKIRPGEERLHKLVKAIDYRLIRLDEDKHTVAYGNPDLYVDFGGIAKGYAVDLAIDLLRKKGVRHAYVSAGGDSRVLGDKRGRPWIIGIQDPRNRDRYIARLPLRDVAISTSGDYERFFIDEQGRHHHILDPKTGRAAAAVRSVTIVGDRCFTTDGLSTGVFVLGVEKGLALVNRLSGVDAVIVDRNGRLFYSRGFTRK